MYADVCPVGVDDSFGPNVVGCRQQFDFTLLFEGIFLAICPSIIFQVFAVFQMRWLRRETRKAKAGVLLPLKLAMCLLYVGLQLSTLVLWTLHPGGAMRVTLLAAALTILDAILICFLSGLVHTRSVRPSPILQLYLVLTLAMDITRARTLYLQRVNDALAAIFTAGSVMKLVLLVLESVEKRSLLVEQLRALAPESTASFLNRCIFWWLNGLIWIGRVKELAYGDLHTMDANLESASLFSRFERERRRYECSDSGLQPGKTSGKNWLLLCLVSTLRWQIIRAAMPRVLLIALKSSQPFLVNDLLSFLASQNSPSPTHAWALILAFALVYFGIAIVNGRYWHQTFRTVVMVRGILVSAVFSKALILPVDETNKGSAVTLISADAERICSDIRNMNEAWANIIELAIAIYLLVRQLGVISLVPLVVAAACSVTSLLMSKYIFQGQRLWQSDLEKRLTITTTFVSNLKSVKMMGLSEWAESTMRVLRLQEIASSLKFRTLLVWSVIIAEVTSMLAPAATLIAFSLMALSNTNDTLLATSAFTSLTILSLIGPPLATFIQTVPNLLAGYACLVRIQALLELRTSKRIAVLERDFMETTQCNSQGTHGGGEGGLELSSLTKPLVSGRPPLILEVSQADISWSHHSSPVLRNINLTIPQSQLLVVTGPVGCGKSTLLNALIGEAHVLKGSLRIHAGNTAFSDQTAWLRDGSVRDNITAGSEYDDVWYKTVIEACDLVTDLDSFVDGDSFRVGSGGQSLSGGQRHRVAIARAVYSRKRFMMFDDVFGAFDNKTARRIFDNIFGSNGLLRQLDVTAVLVAQSLRLLSASDHVLVLTKEGSVGYHGPFAHLHERLHSNLPDMAVPEGDQPIKAVSEAAHKIAAPIRTTEDTDSTESSNARKPRGLYATYVGAIGKFSAISLITLLFLSAFCINYSTLWLSRWSDANNRKPNSNIAQYASVYGVLGIVALITFAIACCLALINMIPKSSRFFHAMLVDATLNAPLYIVSQRSSGDTMNRFSRDLQIVDTQLPFAALNTVEAFTLFIVQMIIIGINAHLTAIFIPFGLACVCLIQRFYLKTSRQLRLMEIDAKGPLLAYCIESLNGLATIRAFDLGQRTFERVYSLLDASQQPYYLLLCVQRWLGFVLDTLIAVLVTLIVTFAVKTGGSGSVGMTGAAIVTVISCSQTLANLVEFWTMMETAFGAIKRIIEFSRGTENEYKHTAVSVPTSSWPEQGLVEFENYSCSYGKTSPLILKNLSFTVAPGQKVAICGRTGSGKSSLALSLCHMLESNSGSVSIDGVDLACVDKATLRSRIATVPQDPFLITDMDVRENLNPGGPTRSDSELGLALEKVGLWQSVLTHDDLARPLSDISLSHGQKQLFCIARALLRERRLIVFDEATSSLDAETNRRFQTLIREHLRGCTVISVEHNLHNVLDYDRVVVLDAGRIVESGVPTELAKTDSTFQRLLRLAR